MVLRYSVAKADLDVLLDIVMKDELKRKGTGTEMKADEELWNAEEVYQLHSGGKEPATYVIRWKDRVATLYAGWILTDGQIETVVKALQNV